MGRWDHFFDPIVCKMREVKQRIKLIKRRRGDGIISINSSIGVFFLYYY
ncbi:MAG: hypothetical protein ACFFG0_30800 [Candidatus Thorarchaeota archaeon]